MILYPGLITIHEPIPFQRLGTYDLVYESDNQIPPDSVKPEWFTLEDKYIFNIYIGYREITIPFPSYYVFKQSVEAVDDDFVGGSTEYKFLKNLFPNLRRYHIPSEDYICRSDWPCGGRKQINEYLISGSIIEWIGMRRYHYLTLKQFCSINFKKYFETIDRDNNEHYKLNMDYLGVIILGNKRGNKDKNNRVITPVIRKHQYEKIEYILKYDIVDFAADFLKKTAKQRYKEEIEKRREEKWSKYRYSYY